MDPQAVCETGGYKTIWNALTVSTSRNERHPGPDLYNENGYRKLGESKLWNCSEGSTPGKDRHHPLVQKVFQEMSRNYVELNLKRDEQGNVKTTGSKCSGCCAPTKNFGSRLNLEAPGIELWDEHFDGRTRKIVLVVTDMQSTHHIARYVLIPHVSYPNHPPALSDPHSFLPTTFPSMPPSQPPTTTTHPHL